MTGEQVSPRGHTQLHACTAHACTAHAHGAHAPRACWHRFNAVAVSIHSSDTHTRTGARTHARTVQRRRRKHPLLLLSQLLLPQRVRAATLVVMFSSAVVHYDKRGPGRLPQCRAPSSPGYRDRDRAVTTMVVPCECAPGLATFCCVLEAVRAFPSSANPICRKGRVPAAAAYVRLFDYQYQ